MQLTVENTSASALRTWLTHHDRFALFYIGASLVVLAGSSNHFENQFHVNDTHTIQKSLYIRDLDNTLRFFTEPATHSVLPINAAYRPLVTSLKGFLPNLHGPQRGFAAQCRASLRTCCSADSDSSLLREPT